MRLHRNTQVPAEHHLASTKESDFVGMLLQMLNTAQNEDLIRLYESREFEKELKNQALFFIIESGLSKDFHAYKVNHPVVRYDLKRLRVSDQYH